MVIRSVVFCSNLQLYQFAICNQSTVYLIQILLQLDYVLLNNT